ncbi:NAD(P)H-quinone oxidoreductase subunit K, chloroplastic [bioreactor metagenome]|uniref:NAD(P)H-quinone oxidoreductase subunit K, chloroplastic n=1 Tax=bioreactor metagenome TaxID=1076179 RepID=A0A644T3U8_9ZZZZ
MPGQTCEVSAVKNVLNNIFKPKVCRQMPKGDADFDKLGFALKTEIHAVFGRSLAIRALDSGSDNSAEIELNNLSNPYYDIERFGLSFVASPRHADILIVTGAVSQNMAIAVRKTFDAMPSPKLVIALGDDACGSGIVCGGYGVLGGVDKILPVDLKIPGNPPEPIQIITALLGLMWSLGKK